jgi:DNA-binding HxlR family transcriptional regulator
MGRASTSHRNAREQAAPATRRFDDACGTAHGLELLGDRWSLLVVRELVLGARRFGQLRVDLPGISANVLTQRLSELEARGILTHKRLPPPASVSVYELTPWGLEAEPIVQSLGRWAARSPLHDPALRISPVSAMLSLKTMFDRERAKDLELTLLFRFNDEAYTARVSGGRLLVERGQPERADVVFEGTPQGLAAAVHGGVPFEQLEAIDMLRVTGSRRAARKFVKLFPLPEKVAGIHAP